MSEQPQPPPEGELITNALKLIRPRLSVREAARRAEISEGWWRQVVRGYQPLRGGGRAPMVGSAETIARMAHVVGVTPEQLESAGRADAAEELRLITPPDLDEPLTDAEIDQIAAEADAILSRLERRIASDRNRGQMEAARHLVRRVVEEETNRSGSP